ncbi:MAG: hypothetical protein ACW97P_01015 [Candidatus Hodarchaeales archaeon]|jgi:hypothetical protein
MFAVKKQNLEKIWIGLVYAGKQIENNFLDLTVNSVSSIKGVSALDFGGSEHRLTETGVITPVKENDPKYGWWNLQKGVYSVVYNELLSNTSYYAIVSPHERLLQSGGFHPTFIHIDKEKPHKIVTILSVCTDKMRIKENARISRALSFPKRAEIE